MVQLEEVKDAELNAPQPGPTTDDYEDDADFTDTGTPHFHLPLFLLPPHTLHLLSISSIAPSTLNPPPPSHILIPASKTRFLLELSK